MEDGKFIKMIYSVFLGLLLAIFIGVGVNTFYPGPKAPDWPTELSYSNKEFTDEERAIEQEFNKRSEQYNKDSKPYNRNVSIIVISASVILLVISLIYEKKIRLIGDGTMLGGLFSLIYGVGRGFASEDSKFVFIAVTISLIVVVYLGYHRFIRHVQPDRKKIKTDN